MEGCPNAEPVAPDGIPKVKEAAGCGCVVVEVNELVAASSFPNVNVDAEGDDPNVAVTGTEVSLPEMSVAFKDFEFPVARPDVGLFSVMPLNANVGFDP